MHLIRKPQQAMLVAGICMAVLHTVIDYIYFNLETIQGHFYVMLTEIFLQSAIYTIAMSKTAITIQIHLGRSIFILSLLNILAAGYKALFVATLAGTSIINDFTGIFPFASGAAYSLAPVGDASTDAIANAMYQCGMCVPYSHVPLNDPFIAYLFVAISFSAGEFNQHILWLTLETINFYTGLVLMKIGLNFYPSIQRPWVIPITYLLLFEVHGVTQQLFKDGIVAFALVCLFHTHSRYIGKGKTGISFELLAVLLIVLLYNLRTGTLAAIICLSVLNCIFNRQRWLIHLRVLLVGLAAILLMANVNGFSGDFMSSAGRATDKVIVGTSTHLDTQNITYTTTKENSLFEKFKLHEVTPSNFFYAPIVKGALYFILPLPVNQYVNLSDRFHKMSTIIYFTLFPLLLVGIVSILKNRTREELYLLAVFGLLVALILGAGPILLPRYRIMALPFFLLIAMLGASRIAPRFVLLAVGISVTLLVPLIIWYENLYGLLQSIV